MGAPEKKDSEGCPQCKGTGKVLLLFTWVDCSECSGPEEATGGPSVRRRTAYAPGSSRAGVGSPFTSRCDDEDDPHYFDDGLEFDDYDPYDDSDPGRWEGDDS